jgi:hypothetical protein
MQRIVKLEKVKVREAIMLFSTCPLGVEHVVEG